MSVQASTREFLSTLDLDQVGHVRAQIALALAAKLDHASADKAPVGLAAASPAIARELRETISELSDLEGEADAFVGALFTA